MTELEVEGYVLTVWVHSAAPVVVLEGCQVKFYLTTTW